MKSILRLLALVSCFMVALSSSADIDGIKHKRGWAERIFGPREETPPSEQTPERAPTTPGEEAEAPKTKIKKVKEVEAADATEVESPKNKKEFTEEEREVLETWKKNSEVASKKPQKKLPPGLQKKLERGGELPPGWKKKLEVGTVLEPELEKEAVPLPEDILQRLPEVEAGTEILRIGDEVVRVFKNSREIIDILSRRQEPVAND